MKIKSIKISPCIRFEIPQILLLTYEENLIVFPNLKNLHEFTNNEL